MELDTGAEGQKLEKGLPGRERSLTISSAVWIHKYNTIQYTNVTDEQTDIGRQQRPRLRTASRGKKPYSLSTSYNSDMTRRQLQ